MTIVITIERPLPNANDLFLISQHGVRGLDVFPDGQRSQETDFPYSALSLYYSSKKHLIITGGRKEKWVPCTVPTASLDLGQFGPEWRGTRLTMNRVEEP
jgi:hypothetical protein